MDHTHALMVALPTLQKLLNLPLEGEALFRARQRRGDQPNYKGILTSSYTHYDELLLSIVNLSATIRQIIAHAARNWENWSWIPPGWVWEFFDPEEGSENIEFLFKFSFPRCINASSTYFAREKPMDFRRYLETGYGSVCADCISAWNLSEVLAGVIQPENPCYKGGCILEAGMKYPAYDN